MILFILTDWDVSDLTDEARVILYEFKSVKGVPPKDFKEQLMKDLTNADELDQIKWIFNGNKNPLGAQGKSFKNTLFEEVDKLPLTDELAKKLVKDIENPVARDLQKLIKEEFANIFTKVN